MRDLAATLAAIRSLQDEARAATDARAHDLARVGAAYRDSASNFLHYLALRRHDLRGLQQDLHELGLSSLGRCEAAVLASLEAVERAASALSGEPSRSGPPPAVSFARGRALLSAHADALFGPPPKGLRTRVMITLNREDVDVERLVALLEGGMGVLRLNLSKGGRADWEAVARDLDAARARTGRPCRFYCDLAGPNPRSAGLEQGPLYLAPGDRLVLGPQAEPTADPPRVAVTLPAILGALDAGHRVFFDDGRIAAVAGETLADGSVPLEVTAARKGRAKLQDSKGINLPDSELPLPSLTDDDLAALDFVIERADVVGLSFLRHPDDVTELSRALATRGGENLGMVLKIETTQAFRRFGAIILAGLARPAPLGVMVARGDLGVELGFERTSEVQEELLWLCEAAHTPVVWATQVLESLTKKGLPTRAEITDAAMAARAECVMLNRGERVRDSLRFLTDVLRRMEQHQEKKLQLFRELSVSHF